MKPCRCLITGGCGFIGRNLIEYFRKNVPAISINILDNLRGGNALGLPGTISFLEGDVRNPQTCLEATKGVELIVHLAANADVAYSIQDPQFDFENNAVGTLNMLEAARKNKVSTFIFASSAAPLGNAIPPIHENSVCRPLSPYGSSKLTGEAYCSSFYHSYKLNTVVLRFGNVYGPLSKNKSCVISKFIKQTLNNQDCEIYGDGSQTRDFIYVEDLVEAILKTSTYKKGGEIFQIATAKEHTVNELAKALKTILEQKGFPMKIKHAAMRTGEIHRNYSDTTQAKKELNWEAKTPLIEGLKQTVDYFLKNHSPR